MLIDCHTHLDAYSEDEVAAVLGRARQAGVGMVVTAGTTLETSTRSIHLSTLFPGLFAGVGIHPMDLSGPVDDETLDRLAQAAKSNEKVLVVSEIGLDFMDGMPDRAIQYQALRAQVRLARELGLPVVFHSREAHDETLRVLHEEQAYQVGGVMHYFQAGLDTARRAIDLGFFISLARPLHRLPYLQDVAAALPLESIVLETDAAPQPFKSNRQKWTEPRHVRDVAEKLAELQDRPSAEVEAVTTKNFLGLIAARQDVVERFVPISGLGHRRGQQ